MDSVAGEPVRRLNKSLDRLLLAVSGVVVAAAGFVVFWIADYQRITSWLLAGCAALGFLVIIGRTYGIRKFKSASFASFAALWLVVHVCAFLLVVDYLGLLFYLPFLFVELWVGFMIAIWRFGSPSDRKGV